MKSYILLENAQFFAYHGVMEQETKVGNVFIVNLKIELDFEEAGKTDHLIDTISYADVFDLIRGEMKISSKLIEHVAYRIVYKLREVYPQIGCIELKLSKQNPPIGASVQVDYASVILIDEKE